MKKQNIYTHSPFDWRETETQICTNISCMLESKKVTTREVLASILLLLL